MDGPWKVYFRLNDKSLEETTEFIRNTVKNKSLWYFHPNGRKAGPHIHGVVWDYDQTAETLRNKIKKFFNLDKKTDYGISNKYERGTLMTDATVPGHVVYLSKGKYNPLLTNVYDNGFFDKCKSEWKEPTAVHISGDLTVITSGEVKTKPRMTHYDVGREAEARYLQKCLTDDEYGNELYQKQRIAVHVMNVLKENKMKCHKRLVIEITQDVMAYINPGEFLDEIISRI